MPCLVEDFLLKMEAINCHHDAVEVIIYSSTADEIIKMLQDGAIDYAVIAETNCKINMKQINRKKSA